MSFEYVTPRIIFVHGRAPKPIREDYQAQLWRCLLEGVARADQAAAEHLQQQPECFHLAYWSDLFYKTQRDLSLDLEGVEGAIACKQPRPEDIAESQRLSRRIKRWIYTLADYFPFLLRVFGDAWIRQTVKDSRRYLHDFNGLGEQVRDRLKAPLRKAGVHQPVILVGHSLGSVIAYDTLWELTHDEGAPVELALFLTLGSPLGTQFIQRALKGWDKTGSRRYPHGIRQWRNLATIGDLAALDPRVEDDFAQMQSLGLLDALSDNTKDLYGTFRDSEGFNPHRSYGYLVLPATGRAIALIMRDNSSPPAG